MLISVAEDNNYVKLLCIELVSDRMDFIRVAAIDQLSNNPFYNEIKFVSQCLR